MRDYDVFKKWLNEILGTPSIRTNEWVQKALEKEMMKKPKRARTKSGKYKAEDKSTKDINEAWVGGKAPTRKELLGLKKKKD